ncbi:MAG: metal-dependent hydrolase [Acidimicrobiia bacterium]
MIFWHVGATLAIVRWVFRDPKMDVRFVILGALLPDLVDKPIGAILFFRTFRNGRIFAHTLLFSLLLLVAAMLLTRRGTRARQAWLGVPIGSLLHLVLDGMWAAPVTFWWPLFGWSFPQVPEAYWTDLIRRVTSDPLLVAEEALGLAYLVYLWNKAHLTDLERRRSFFRTGQLEES